MPELEMVHFRFEGITFPDGSRGVGIVFNGRRLAVVSIENARDLAAKLADVADRMGEGVAT